MPAVTSPRPKWPPARPRRPAGSPTPTDPPRSRRWRGGVNGSGATTAGANGAGAGGAGRWCRRGAGGGAGGSGGWPAGWIRASRSGGSTPLAFTGGDPRPVVLAGALLLLAGWMARRRLLRTAGRGDRDDHALPSLSPAGDRWPSVAGAASCGARLAALGSAPAGATTDPATLSGEGGTFLGPVVTKLIDDATSNLAGCCGAYVATGLDHGITDFVGSGPQPVQRRLRCVRAPADLRRGGHGEGQRSHRSPTCRSPPRRWPSARW